jgi:6,7-dimethyl-8-ribityllumazine synthase
MADVSNSTLLHGIKGIHHIQDAFVVLVKTEWNAAIVDELERGCMGILKSCGVQSKTIVVPGAVEIPFAIKQCWANRNRAAAFIALGCIVRGDTPHFEYVCQAVTGGVSQLNVTLPVPVIFGVLTVDTIEQAQERIGGKHGHKGEEAALTAIKMMLLNQEIIRGGV